MVIKAAIKDSLYYGEDVFTLSSLSWIDTKFILIINNSLHGKFMDEFNVWLNEQHASSDSFQPLKKFDYKKINA